MTRISQTGIRTFAALILLILGSSAAQAAPTNCINPTITSVDCQMKNGARWELSWANDAKKGLVLSNITLTPKPNAPRTLILEQASLAQVLLAYDNNSGTEHLASDAGLPLTPLSASDCPLGNLVGGGLVCQMVLPRGYAWRGGPSGSSAGQIQGETLVIFGVSAAGGNTYIHQWLFDDAGTIQPMLGVSGQLDQLKDSTAATGWPISAPTRFATNRFHTAYWRLHFALGGQGNELFQQLDHTAANSGYNHNQTITDITTEGKFNISPESQRFWMVKDKVISNAPNGQKITFEIIPQHTSVHRGADPFTGFDVYITQNRTCEQFASHNPTNPACAADLPGFVNGELLGDPVAWVGTTWHQVPRAEDESDIQTHWQGFILAPRDFTATSPL